jgi:pyrimidine-specific ribonucleoside hydrolase
MRYIYVLSLLFLAFFSFGQKQRVWVDTDIMIGKFRHDVDDGLALLMLLNDTNLVIEGISFVHGVDYAEKVTTKLLKWYAPDKNITLHKGTDDSTGFGKRTAAVDAMILALEKGPMKLLALGPMTNVATVLQLRPDLLANVEVVAVCAGRKPGMHFSPGSAKFRFADYNFDLDPRSMNVVLSTQVPMLLAGYDCSDSLFLSKSDFIHLRYSDRPGDKWLYRKLKSWHSLWVSFIGVEQGFIPFDCSTYGALFIPNAFNKFNTGAVIRIEKNDSKNTVRSAMKPYLFMDDSDGLRKVSYCDHTKQEFKTVLLKTLNHPEHR